MKKNYRDIIKLHENLEVTKGETCSYVYEALSLPENKDCLLFKNEAILKAILRQDYFFC